MKLIKESETGPVITANNSPMPHPQPSDIRRPSVTLQQLTQHLHEDPARDARLMTALVAAFEAARSLS